jgi:hypothetical protein
MIIRNWWGLACGDLPAFSLPFATQAIQHFLAKPCAWCVFRVPEAFVIVYGKVGLKTL